MEKKVELLKSTIQGLNYRYNSLKKINELTGEADDTKDFLDKTLGVIMDLIGGEGGAAFLYGKTGFLKCMAFRADIPFNKEKEVKKKMESIDVSTYKFPDGNILSGDKKINYSTSPDMSADYRKLIKNTLRELKNTLIVAVRVNNEVTGVLEFYNIVRELNPDKEKSILSMGGHIGVSVELFDRLDSLERRTDALKRLTSVTEKISSARQLGEVLDLLIENSISYFRADACFIILKNQNDNFELFLNTAENSHQVKGEKIQNIGGVVNKILNTGESVLFQDVKKENNYTGKIDDFTRLATGSAAGVPLKVAGEITGLIMVARKKESPPFDEEALELLNILASHASIALNKAKIYSMKDKWFDSTVNLLVKTIKTKHNLYPQHAENVRKYLKKISEEMNLNNEQREYLQISASVKEIGKLTIPENLLQKEEKLSREEWEKIRKHPLKSVEILETIDEFKEIIPIIKFYHEHYDGTGYPKNLTGEEIPLLARILSVVDAYVAMREPRPYRDILPKEVAIQNLKEQKGKQFDPKIVDIMVEILEREK
ncbi:MAG: HD domain-containing phosphohydrolase [Elusimicrobiota bacterium]